jgi:hypothetical protein
VKTDRAKLKKPGGVYFGKALYFMCMSNGGKTLVCLGAGLVLAFTSGADAANPPSATDLSNPYNSIVVRNVFLLKPTPPPPVNPGPTTPVTPPPDVKVRGMTTILGYPQAIFEMTPKGKPPESHIMTDGERQGSLELVKINMAEKSTLVKIDGGPAITIALDTKVGAAPGGGAIGGGMPQVTTPGGGRGNFSPVPSGQPVPSPLSRNQAVMPAAVDAGGAAVSALGFPSRPLRTDQQGQLTPDQSVVLLETQRAQAIKEGNPVANILPPTAMTSQVLQEMGGAAPQQQQQNTGTPTPTPINMNPALRPNNTVGLPPIPR